MKLLPQPKAYINVSNAKSWTMNNKLQMNDDNTKGMLSVDILHGGMIYILDEHREVRACPSRKPPYTHI